MKKVTLMIMIAIALITVSCSKQMIQGTKIEDTPENREILSVFHAYAQAMQDRDGEALKAVVSKNYHDKNGTDISEDDVDFEGVVQFLNSPEYQNITKLNTTYVLKDMQIKSPTEAVIFYFYELQARRKSALPSDEQELAVAKGSQWLKVSDDMVMSLKKENGKWFIISGL